MGIGQLQVVQNFEWINNSENANLWSQILVFQIAKILQIRWFSNLKNFKNFQF